MQYQKPKSPDKVNPKNVNDKKFSEIIGTIAKDHFEKTDFANKTYDNVDEVFSRQLSSSVTFYYFFMSIITACIGFSVSLTINNKFAIRDIFIYVALIIWTISFVLCIRSVHRTNSAIMNFNYFILGNKIKHDKLSEDHLKLAKDEIDNGDKLSKSPIVYFTLAVFFFMLWFIFKIASN